MEIKIVRFRRQMYVLKEIHEGHKVPAVAEMLKPL